MNRLCKESLVAALLASSISKISHCVFTLFLSTHTKTHDQAQVANLLRFSVFPITAEVLIGAGDELLYSAQAEKKQVLKKKEKQTGVKAADCCVMSARREVLNST